MHRRQLHLQTFHPEAAAFSQLSDLVRASSRHAFLAALNHFCAQSLPAHTEKLLRLEALSQPASVKASVQTPLPERPQLLPHRPRPAADVGHNLLLVLDVLKDLLWVMALSLFFSDIIVRVAGSPAHTPREENKTNYSRSDPQQTVDLHRIQPIRAISLLPTTHPTFLSEHFQPYSSCIMLARQSIYFSGTKCCLNISSKST